MQPAEAAFEYNIFLLNLWISLILLLFNEKFLFVVLRAEFLYSCTHGIMLCSSGKTVSVCVRMRTNKGRCEGSRSGGDRKWRDCH